MGRSPLLALLAIIIALSAYLATIRLAGIQLAKAPTGKDDSEKEANKKSIEWKLVFIALPDIFLVASGLFLAIYLFGGVFDWMRADGQLTWGVRLFCVAIVILAFYHLVSWFRSGSIAIRLIGKSIREGLQK
jgi:O-antigen/teichoic acid export membrane protein